MRPLAPLVFLAACSTIPESQCTHSRIPLPGDLLGELRMACVEPTRLLIVRHRDDPVGDGDVILLVDLELGRAEARRCLPPGNTPGFGAALCLSADGRRVLAGTVTRLSERDAGIVRAYRWPDLTLEFEVRSERNGDGFGSSIAEIADQDGDGRPDYAVGAPWGDQAALTLISGVDGHIVRRIEGAGMGWALAHCSDADGDKIAELAVVRQGALDVLSGRDLHLLRTLGIGGMFPVLTGGAGLALLSDDGGSWPYSSHLTVSAWSPVSFERACHRKTDAHAHLYASPGSPCGARLLFPEQGRLVSSDVSGGDERELAPCGEDHPREVCEIPAGGPTRWRTAVVLGLAGGAPRSELLLSTR